jgi:hypothetical protein
VITRKRKRKPSAADEYKAALAALPRGESRVMPATFEEFAQENLGEDPHERLERALKKSMAGIMKGGPKTFAKSKTQRNIARKYAPIIAELEQAKVPLGRPYTSARRAAIEGAMRESKAFREMRVGPTGAAFIKHLQRHYKT